MTAVVVLDTAWILIGGLPDIARSERVIRNMSRILGKVVVVDELSLREEEVRLTVKSFDSSKLRAMVRVFFNDQGFNLRISREPPNHICRPRVPDDSLLGVAQMVEAWRVDAATAALVTATTPARRRTTTPPRTACLTTRLPPHLLEEA